MKDILGIQPLSEAGKLIVSKSVDGISTFLSLVCEPALQEFGLMLSEFDDNEFPITLDKIILGSNCPEKDVNRDQIETMAQEDNIVIKYGVSLSKKNSYRVSY